MKIIRRLEQTLQRTVFDQLAVRGGLRAYSRGWCESACAARSD
jgi:hypothetical protein